MINIPYKELNNNNSRFSPGLQFLIFFFLFVFVLIAANIIGGVFVAAIYGTKTLVALTTLNTTAPNFTSALWIMQLVGTTLPIFASPVIFAYFIVADPADYIKPGLKFSWLLLPVVLAVMLISNPLIELLSNINAKMVLPPYLQWMKDKEDDAQKMTAAMLQMKNVWDVIVNILLIGLLTAIVEEFMFRGCLQTIFIRWTKNKHVAIWITAILFSAFHIEFYGFLPRLLLGAFFGYFVAWSGSIWPGVWAHFINNGTAVVATYLYQKKVFKTNPDDQHIFNSTAYIISFIIVLFLLYFYRNITLNKHRINNG